MSENLTTYRVQLEIGDFMELPTNLLMEFGVVRDIFSLGLEGDVIPLRNVSFFTMVNIENWFSRSTAINSLPWSIIVELTLAADYLDCSRLLLDIGCVFIIPWVCWARNASDVRRMLSADPTGMERKRGRNPFGVLDSEDFLLCYFPFSVLCRICDRLPSELAIRLTQSFYVHVNFDLLKEYLRLFPY